MSKKRHRPRVVLLFDINLQTHYLKTFRELFASFEIEIIFLGQEEKFPSDKNPPNEMSDPELLEFAARLLGKKFRNWRKDMKAFLITADQKFITRIEIRKVPLPDSGEKRAAMMRAIAYELERITPGITARLEGQLPPVGTRE